MREEIATEKEVRDLAYIMFQMGLNNAWTSNFSEELEKRIKQYIKKTAKERKAVYIK